MSPLDQSVATAESKGPRILIADDHSIVRVGLSVLIRNILDHVHIEEAIDGDEVVKALRSASFDLLVLDMNMPNTESFSLTRYLRKEFPLLKILIFTINKEVFFAKRCLRMGVQGYVIKQGGEAEVKDAIRAILQGHTWFSDTLIELVSNNLIGATRHNPFERLSDREFELILQILKGHAVTDIAATLHMTESTVRTHKSRIMKKLRLSGPLSLMDLARQHNII
jgi:two-component system, NarL family, invasion response regulator UvrY